MKCWDRNRFVDLRQGVAIVRFASRGMLRYSVWTARWAALGSRTATNERGVDPPR